VVLASRPRGQTNPIPVTTTLLSVFDIILKGEIKILVSYFYHKFGLFARRARM
jgi:hypothetical protein